MGSGKLKKNRSRNTWFIYAVTGGALPIILRIFFYFGRWAEMIDIKDVIFWGLALNLTNLNLFGIVKNNSRDELLGWTGLLTIILGIALGAQFSNESKGSGVHPVALALGLVCTGLSLYLSNEVNKGIKEI